MHVGNYYSTRTKVSEGDLNYCCLKYLRTDYGQTDTRLGLGMCAERGSLHLISSHTMSRTVQCQQFENVRSVAQSGMGSI